MPTKSSSNFQVKKPIKIIEFQIFEKS